MSIYNELSVIEKYLKIINTDFLNKRLHLKDKNKKHVTLICDVLREPDRKINRMQRSII